jgi:hypothetical protein
VPAVMKALSSRIKRHVSTVSGKTVGEIVDKIVLVALRGLTAGQAMVWYTGQFYALFFLTQTLKVDAQAANLMIAASLLIGTPFFIVFGALSDRIGRKRIIMAGCALAILTYFPIFKGDHPLRQPGARGGASAMPT